MSPFRLRLLKELQKEHTQWQLQLAVARLFRKGR